MATTTISLDSDDEDAHMPATGRGTSRDAPVELSSDDDADEPAAGSGAGRAGSSGAAVGTSSRAEGAAAGSSTSALVMDLTGEEEDVPGCGICGKLTSARDSYRLDECGHGFCEGCVRSFVSKKVLETLAHEVGCPKCGRQLSIGNVNELAKTSAEPGAKRPRPGAPTPWRGGGPAALLAHLAGGGGMPGGGQAGRRVAGNQAATKRIMKELQALRRAGTAAQGFEVSVPDESDAYTWQAEFFDFEKGSGLAADLKRVPGKRIVLSVAFPSSFPSQPPYMRVIRPRFAFRTGHVTIGGSICTEMLSNQACTWHMHSTHCGCPTVPTPMHAPCICMSHACARVGCRP